MLYVNDGDEDFGLSVQRPACQVAACFEPASVYVVIKESDINALSLDVREKQMIIEKDFPYDINAFKLILYLCARQGLDWSDGLRHWRHRPFRHRVCGCV